MIPQDFRAAVDSGTLVVVRQELAILRLTFKKRGLPEVNEPRATSQPDVPTAGQKTGNPSAGTNHQRPTTTPPWHQSRCGHLPPKPFDLPISSSGQLMCTAMRLQAHLPAQGGNHYIVRCALGLASAFSKRLCSCCGHKPPKPFIVSSYF